MQERGGGSAMSPVATLLARRVADMAEGVALAVDGGGCLTYRSWDQRSNATARGLIEREVGPGDRVVLHFDNARWLDYAIAFTAVSKIGAVAVPVARRLCPLEVRRIVADCGAVGTLAPDDLAPTGTGGWGAATVDLEAGQSCDALERPPAPAGTGEILYGSGPLRPPSRLTVPAAPAPFADGATAALFAHAFILGTHAGQWALRLPLLHPGSQSVTFGSFDPDRFCAAVAERRADALGLAPFLAIALVESGATDRHDLSTVRQVVMAAPLASDAMTAALKAAFPAASATVWPAPAGWGPEPAAEAVAPVTTIQATMLWEEQFSPGRYNLQPLVRRMVGPLGVDALRWALNEILRRHEPLRTTFRLLGEDAVQVVSPTSDVELPVRDLSLLPRAERDAQVKARISEATNDHFDLVRGPLFQPELLRLAPEEHLIVIPLHHCVWDAHSIGVFHRELSALYSDRLASRPSSLPALPLRFSDLCLAERHGSGRGTDAGLSYRAQQLAGAPLISQLPIGDPDLPEGTPHAGTDPVSIDLPPALVSDLRNLARSERATLFMVLLAAFQVLVHRYTDQDDVLVSSMAARRERGDARHLLGFAANRVVLRLRLAGDPLFAEVLSDARGVVLGAVTHPDVAESVLLERVLGPHAWRHGLIPKVMLLFQAAGLPDPIELPGVATTALRAAEMEAKRVHMTPAQPGFAGTGAKVWRCGLSYGTFLGLSVLDRAGEVTIVARGTFHRPSVERLLAQLRVLLSDVVARPHVPVSELAVLTESERTEVRHRSTETDVELGDRCVPELFEAQVSRSPDQVAVVMDGQVLTYAELNTSADRVAEALRGLGVGPEKLVGLSLRPSPTVVAAVLGVWKAGGAYVPLSHQRRIAGEGGASLLGSVDVLIADADAGDDVVGPHRAVLLLGRDGAPVDGAMPPGGPAPPAALGDLACVVTTDAGPRQRPAVMLEHRAVLNLLVGLRHVYELAGDLGPHPRAMLTADLCHPAFLRQLVGLCDGRGLRFVADPTAQPGDAVSCIGRGEIEMVDVTVADVEALLHAGLEDALQSSARSDLGPVALVVSGETLETEVREALERLANASVVRLLAPAECGFGATACRMRQGATRDIVGTPLPNVRRHVLDRRGRPVPTGVAGELHLGGAGLARGHLGRPPRSEERFVQDPFGGRPGDRLFSTRLVARIRADGEVEMVGRTGDFLDLRGYRVRRSQVEAAMRACPGVKDVAVAVPDVAPHGPTMVAYVVPDDDGPPSLAQLRGFLWSRLPGYAWPAALVVVAALLRRPDGEADVGAMPLPQLAATAAHPSASELRPPQASVLAAAWGQARGGEPAGMDEGYGLSFAFAEAVSVAYQSGTAVSGPQVLENRTLETLAAAMAILAQDDGEPS